MDVDDDTGVFKVPCQVPAGWCDTRTRAPRGQRGGGDERASERAGMDEKKGERKRRKNLTRKCLGAL